MRPMADPIDALASELSTTPPAELHDRLTEAVADLSLRDRFTLLHRLGVYHHPDSFSGPAATLDETAALREALPEIVAQWSITTMLDVPCGDFAWMRHLDLDVDYIGADIVSELVVENQKRYASKRRRFIVLDATRDALPAVDLIVCRDLLIHLSIADCFSLLKNFVSSRSRVLLTSHFENRSSNSEIVSGDFRPINLCRAPFNLPPPLRIINERSSLGDGEFTDRSMALWELRTVRRALGIA
jgi:hypothetical protein